MRAVVSLVGVETVLLRGQVVVENAKFVGRYGRENSSLQICTHPVTKTEINQV